MSMRRKARGDGGADETTRARIKIRMICSFGTSSEIPRQRIVDMSGRNNGMSSRDAYLVKICHNIACSV
jgi:hypothetical protein